MIEKLKTVIWNLVHQKKAGDVSPLTAFFIRVTRITYLTLRNFTYDKCDLRASALTFYALLSVVPVVAMAFGIAKGFGFEKLLEQQLLEVLPGQQEVVEQIISFARNLLDNTRGGLLAGIGVGLLFWTVIKVLGSIESSFNDIWKIDQNRSIARKFSDYLSLMLIGPVLVILSGSLNVFLTTQLETMTKRIALLGYVSPFLFFMMKLLPFVLIWVLFTFLYIFLPNTRVRFYPGLIAGIIAGTSYQITQGIYISFQVGVAKYNAIYGSFAVLPLFLLWLQISWLIVLLGAEISFAIQNSDMIETAIRYPKLSLSQKKLLALLVAREIYQDFVVGDSPPASSELAHRLELSPGLVQSALSDLVSCGIITLIPRDDHQETVYHPSHNPETMTIAFALASLENTGKETVHLPANEHVDSLTRRVEKYSERASSFPDDLPLYRISDENIATPEA